MAANISQVTGGIAERLAQDVGAAFRAHPHDLALHGEALYDLKLAAAREAAKLADFADEDLILETAQNLPGWDTSSLYQARTSLLALASAVFVGWILGGILSALLGFLDLGGEILRPAAILVCIWLEEWLGVNPGARRVMLAIMGLGALGRFAASLAAGIVRFTSLSSLRQLVFGGARVGFLKSVWLWFGAFFLLVFFARKTTGIDIASFQESLTEQLKARLELLVFVFGNLKRLQGELKKCERGEAPADSALCPKANCGLAKAALSLLDTLPPDSRDWLSGALTQVGYAPLASKEDRLIWDEARHRQRFETFGVVRQGDICQILRHPYVVNDHIEKGLVQRLPESGA